VLPGNSAATLRTSSRGTIVSRSPPNTRVGTFGYMGCGGVTGEDGVGISHHRHCFCRLTSKLAAAFLEKGAKASKRSSDSASANCFFRSPIGADQSHGWSASEQ